MVYNVQISANVNKDMDDIFSYIAEKLCDSQAASKLADALYEKIILLQVIQSAQLFLHGLCLSLLSDLAKKEYVEH